MWEPLRGLHLRPRLFQSSYPAESGLSKRCFWRTVTFPGWRPPLSSLSSISGVWGAKSLVSCVDCKMRIFADFIKTTCFRQGAKIPFYKTTVSTTLTEARIEFFGVVKFGVKFRWNFLRATFSRVWVSEAENFTKLSCQKRREKQKSSCRFHSAGAWRWALVTHEWHSGRCRKMQERTCWNWRKAEELEEGRGATCRRGKALGISQLAPPLDL